MRHVSGWWLVKVVMLCALGGAIAACRQPASNAQETSDAVTTFLQRHWQVPVPLQGAPPQSYSDLEASLHPKECGICHPQQFQDWQTSLHSRSMGPGIYGQLVDMESDPATYTLCATCHTPLQEQIPFVERDATYQPNPKFDKTLQHAGLVCAACHVRQHQRFGPPRRPELPAIPPGTQLPHGGFTVSPAYQQSAFCKPCHQFEPDGFGLNGKLLENTYEEWRQSRYAAEGQTCQTCHMPDRRHLWRGIHDPEMVRAAMTVKIEPNAASYAPGDQMRTAISVTNSGAGHYFPTYVTPKLFIRAQLLDAQDKVIDATAQEAVIGREVTLNLSEEVYDTRIPPDGSYTVEYEQVIPTGAETLRVRIVVHPDHFYRRFFEAVLQDGGGKGRKQLQDALRRAEASPFTAFEQEIALQKRK
jgi:hypothetical protein